MQPIQAIENGIEKLAPQYLPPIDVGYRAGENKAVLFRAPLKRDFRAANLMVRKRRLIYEKGVHKTRHLLFDITQNFFNIGKT